MTLFPENKKQQRFGSFFMNLIQFQKMLRCLFYYHSAFLVQLLELSWGYCGAVFKCGYHPALRLLNLRLLFLIFN